MAGAGAVAAGAAAGAGAGAGAGAFFSSLGGSLFSLLEPLVWLVLLDK